MSNKINIQERQNLHFGLKKALNETITGNYSHIKFPTNINKQNWFNFRSLEKLVPLKQVDQNQILHSLQKSHLLDVYIYLIYKNNKIALTFQSGTSLKIVAQTLYKKVLQFEFSKAKLSMQKAEQETSKVLGFQSQDNDLQFDYLLSIAMEASENKLSSKIEAELVLNKTKFLKPFFHKTNSSNEILYKICKCLAIGGFSKVYLARSYTDGKFYAIKFIKKFPQWQRKSLVNYDESNADRQRFQTLMNEMEISKDLDHPFLVKLYHAFETESFFCLVQEYCPGGELFYLLKKKRIFSEKQAKFYFLQILYGLSYLHEKSIIYRDLKPENVLIDWQGNLKIVDFGLSKKISRNKERSFTYCGSAEYMAPQMVLRMGHSYSLDYYSLGAILYELVTGLPPFYTKDSEALEEAILYEGLSFPSQIFLTNQLKDLLIKLLQKEEKYRLGSFAGLKEILFHPWIGKINSVDILQKKLECPYPPDLTNHNFDPNELGQDEELFTRLVKKELFSDSPTKTQKINQSSPYVKKSASFQGLKKSFNPNGTKRTNQQSRYKNTFYKTKTFQQINSTILESVKHEFSLHRVQSNYGGRSQQSETPLLRKSISVMKLNTSSVPKNPNFLLNIREEKIQTIKRIYKLSKRPRNHNQSLDKLHHYPKASERTPYFPSFSKEKKQTQRSNEFVRIEKNNTHHLKRPQFDERLFSNLKNTYLSSSPFKRQFFEGPKDNTLRVNKSQENISKFASLAKLTKRIPQPQKNPFTKASLQYDRLIADESKSKIFQVNESPQFGEKRSLIPKKKLARGNKHSLAIQTTITKNQILEQT